MPFRTNRRLLGLMLAPFALFTACVGLTPEEQAEYKELQDEVLRIQVEEIQPRQEQLKQIIDGKLVVNVEQLQEQVNQIRNEQIEPLNKKLASLKSGEQVFAAPGTRLDLEQLNLRLDELKRLHTAMEAQIAEHREQLAAAKAVAAEELEAAIAELEIALAEAESDEAAEQIEAEIAAVYAEIEVRHSALVEQFGILIHGLEMSLHDISEEKEDVVRAIHELELSAEEELGKTIEELEGAIDEIITHELRPLIEQLNAATTGDVTEITREQLRGEIEEWLAELASMRARLNELTARSFQSWFNGLDLSGLLKASG